MLKHFTFLGISPAQIKVKDFERDEDYTTYANERGEWFEEHSVQLKGGLFDRIVMKVPEHSKNDPVRIWLEKDVCSLSNLIVLAEEITRAYGERYLGDRVINPFKADSNDLAEEFSFCRSWTQLSIKYERRKTPQLVVHAVLDDEELEP